MVFRPCAEVVLYRFKLFLHIVNAANNPSFVLIDYPVPEAGHEVKSVVPVLRINKDVGVEDIHAYIAPTCSPSWTNVSCFRAPTSRYASR